jgi:catalase
MLGGGPSVLYDAVAVLVSPDDSALLAKDAAAKDFVSDAFAHCKFIAYSADAMPLFEKTGIASDLDGGCLELGAEEDVARFVGMCRELRFWEREPKVKS